MENCEITTIPPLNSDKWMCKAFELAEKALSRGEVPVGCLIVYKDKIIGIGANEVNVTHNATRHCEMVAIDAALTWAKSQDNSKFENDGNTANSFDIYQNIFKQSILYVTVEPCIMCAAALRNMKIQMVCYGCENERFGGCGSVFNAHNISLPDLGESLTCIGGNAYYKQHFRDDGNAKEVTPFSKDYASYAIQLLKQFYLQENPNAPAEKRKIKS